MLHLLAVILTLFPGFGLGYLLLGRWKQFALSFLGSTLFGSLILIGVLVMTPPASTGVIFVASPIFLAINFYAAHALWIEQPGSGSVGKYETSDDSWVAPWFMKVALGLGVIMLGVVLADQFWPETPDTPQERNEKKLERRADNVEEQLSQHTLSNRVKISDGGAAFHYQYHVEPGGYTMDLFFTSLERAEEIKRQTDNLVFYYSDNVLVLHTTDTEHLKGIADDARGSFSGDCEASRLPNRYWCGYAVDCVETYSYELRKATYICE